MSNDIVVIARPEIVTSVNFTNPAPSPIATSQQARVIFMSQLQNVDQDDDVEGEEIVVTGRRLKQEITMAGVNALNQQGVTFSLPCIGSTKRSEIASLLQRLKFKITNEDFGPAARAKTVSETRANLFRWTSMPKHCWVTTPWRVV